MSLGKGGDRDPSHDCCMCAVFKAISRAISNPWDSESAGGVPRGADIHRYDVT